MPAILKGAILIADLGVSPRYQAAGPLTICARMQQRRHSRFLMPPLRSFLASCRPARHGDDDDDDDVQSPPSPPPNSSSALFLGDTSAFFTGRRSSLPLILQLIAPAVASSRFPRAIRASQR